MTGSNGTTDWIAYALSLRDQHWDKHPIVTAKAKIATVAVRTILGLATDIGTYQRESLAVWAHPTTGKSTCIEILKAYLPVAFPGVGVAKYEFKPVDQEEKNGNTRKETFKTFENALLRDVLEELEYEPKIEYTLAGKRRQLRKLLESIAGSSRHLFLILDEAQSMDERSMKIFKSITNGLISRAIGVTTILFGQSELVKQLQVVATEYRSDLHIRFAKNIVRLDGIRSSSDMKDFLMGLDCDSEWPLGTGLTYAQFLFPVAFANGFRFANTAVSFFNAFGDVSPLRPLENGIAMEYVAKALAKLCKMKKGDDDSSLVFTDDEMTSAVRSVGYGNRMSVRDINQPSTGGSEEK